MKRILPYLMIMVLLLAPAGAWGQDNDTDTLEDPAVTADVETEDDGGFGDWDTPDELPAMQYHLAPEFSAWMGYRFVELDGSVRALEYAWPHSNPTGGLLLHYSPLPHRLDFELDWNNQHDYQSEVSYAYRDIVKLDYRGWSLYHNLDHFRPLYHRPVIDYNAGAGVVYHATARDNRVRLRLKWPDRAFHAFLEYREFAKEGTIQQRVYKFEPSASSTKTSMSRDIDWVTRHMTLGINGHLGPLELEYTHRMKEFDTYTQPSLVTRFDPAGSYWTHHATPELSSFSDNLKVHTDLQGRVVAAMTLTRGEKDNEKAHATVEYWRAHTDLVLIPFEHLTIALKYRFNELSVNNPDTVSEYDAVTGGLIRTEPSNDPMDTRMNRAEVTARYSPKNSLSFKAGYTFTKTERFGAGVWSDRGVIPSQDIPYDQNEHRATVGFSARPWRELTCRGSVYYTYTQDPAYPIKPVNSFKGRFDTAWIPKPGVTAEAYYRFTRESNNTANMKFERDNIGALTTWQPLKAVALYANYDYNRQRNERDIGFIVGRRNFTVMLPDDVVAYEDRSHLYAVGATYAFEFPLRLEAEFHQSWSKGRYRTDAKGVDGDGNTETTAGMGELTDLKIRETGGKFKAGYDFPKGWGASVEYGVNDYQDLQDKPQNGPQDGIAQSVMVLVSKKW